MGGKSKQKRDSKKKSSFISRKDMRKQMRKQKKAKKNDYFKNKKKLAQLKTTANGLKKKSFNNNSEKNVEPVNVNEPLHKANNPKITVKPQSNFLDERNKLHKEEMKEKNKLERGMIKQRKKMLLEANEEEDKAIKKLEKQLKLNKRKSNSVPQSFADDGLDFLLEVCDPQKLKEVGDAELNLQESGSEFEDDLALVMGKGKRKSERKEEDHSQKKKKPADKSIKEVEDSDVDDSFSSDNESQEFKEEVDEEGHSDQENEEDFAANAGVRSSVDSENERVWDDEVKESKNQDESEYDNNESEEEKESEDEEMGIGSVFEESNVKVDDNKSKESKKQNNGMWEDIYGRCRDSKGNVIQEKDSGKYVPPHLRVPQLAQNAKKSEELSRLQKQLKGLINRLAESNMHSIAKQIDDLYMRNSRSDMNNSLLALIMEALVGRVLTAERLVMEYAMLIAILHANVGMEVGAYFLQCFIQKFDVMYKEGQDVENKELDNILLILSHLYNFKVFHAVLMYNILEQLTEQFTEKEVELILLVLRSVGFSLRKDDPLALKDLVLRLQKKANESIHLRDNTRVRFMLDVLLAVKNNNMTKIPQYDHSHSEHLKKMLKTLVHKGKYVTELKVTLEDLLKADERGRWWIVGSAWSGDTLSSASSTKTPSVTQTSQFSESVLQLARKQRMNTDTRRSIFCILMTAEDYMDAFQKLLRLSLKGQQDQEIIHVMIHCLMQEKRYNPYYAHLAIQFCKADRKHQMTIQYSLWDKLKELSNLSSSKITNLAKFLAHLFLEKSLPLSVLKVMQFSEMDKPCVRLLRQVLLSLLLSDSEETMLAVFTRVSKPEKLHMFRESMRLFLHHFVLKNVSDLPEDQAHLLAERVKLAETALISVDTSRFL